MTPKRPGLSRVMRRTALTLGMLATFSAVSRHASAMQAGTHTAGAATGDTTATVAVSGTVYDSVEHAPLAGALVQLVDPQHSSRAYNATTDAHGAFVMPAVVPGRYAAGFYHPSLEALGLEPPLTGVDVEPGRPTSIALMVPGGKRISTAVCGARAPGDTSGALVGVVRDADTGAPLAGATVDVVWHETRIDSYGIRRMEQHAPAKTREDGGYVICGLPNDRILASADSGQHHSGLIEVTIPTSSLARRDFLVAGPGAAVEMRADSTRGVRSAIVLRGTARLAGVVRKPDGAPMAGARVTVPGSGLSATTGANGGFSIANLPAGTFSAQARAIGFSPVTTTVDLASARTDSVSITLADRAEVSLAPVTVYGTRPHTFDAMTQFAARRRQGFGHYLVPADLRNSITVTDALKRVPGLQVVRTSTGIAIYGRGGCDRAAGCSEPACRPAVYLDGMRLPNETHRSFAADPSLTGMEGASDSSVDTTPAGDPPDIDQYIDPGQVMGIEVYNSPAGVPGEYQTFDGAPACGVILIWSRR